jgi:hypothetical protein
MNEEELLAVLLRTNKKRNKPVDDQILKSILSIVIMNPLEENRGKSQEQIQYILSKTRIE